MGLLDLSNRIGTQLNDKAENVQVQENEAPTAAAATANISPEDAKAALAIFRSVQAVAVQAAKDARDIKEAEERRTRAEESRKAAEKHAQLVARAAQARGEGPASAIALIQSTARLGVAPRDVLQEIWSSLKKAEDFGFKNAGHIMTNVMDENSGTWIPVSVERRGPFGQLGVGFIYVGEQPEVDTFRVLSIRPQAKGLSSTGQAYFLEVSDTKYLDSLNNYISASYSSYPPWQRSILDSHIECAVRAMEVEVEHMAAEVRSLEFQEKKGAIQAISLARATIKKAAQAWPASQENTSWAR